MLRGSCSGRGLVTDRHRSCALRGSCNREPAVLLGRGNDSADIKPDHCRSASRAYQARTSRHGWLTADSSQTTRLEPREGLLTPMTLITKRRLTKLVSASAIVAVMAVAALPAATLAAPSIRSRPAPTTSTAPTGWAHVDVTAADGLRRRSMFTSTRPFASCFEYRTDGGAGRPLATNGRQNCEHARHRRALPVHLCEQQHQDRDALIHRGRRGPHGVRRGGR